MFIRSMDEDDEIQSQPSPDSPSHSPPLPPPQQPPQSQPQPQPQPQPSNQIIVTVAAAPPSSIPMSIPLPPQQSSSNLTLALPIQQFSRPPSAALFSGVTGVGGGGGGGREDCWSEGATSVLIDAWGERYMELSRGNLKQKHWKEVADIVSSREDYAKPPKTDIQCKNRIDTVKKKYKIEKQKIAAGCGPSTWPFFERLDRLIGPSATLTAATATVSAAETPSSQAVPVGIPVGIRPLPLPFSPHCLQTPPHLLPQSHQQLTQHRQHFHHQQQQQLRQHHQQLIHQRQQTMQNFKVRTPPNGLPRYNASTSKNNTDSGGGNVNRIHTIHNIGSWRPQFQQQFRRMPQAITMVDSDLEADGEEWSNGDSGDSLPPERNVGFGQRKRPRVESKRGEGGGIERGKEKGKVKRKEKKASVKAWGNSVRELTRAILKFGEAYEAAESTKLQHIAEIEKQRMNFAKELELQRMKFMMKTQLQISQYNGNVNGSNNSDSRGGASGGGVGDGGEGNHHHLHHIREDHLNHDENSDSST